MKRCPLILHLLTVLLCLTAVSCQKYDGFKRGSGGYYYRYHITSESDVSPKTGDFVEVNMALRAGDEVLTPMTRNNMLVDDLYSGDFFTALRNMHLGDSATFIFDGKKFYEEFLNMGEYPYGATPVYADVKLLKILSKDNLEKANEMYQEQRKEQSRQEDSIVKAYANMNNLTNSCRGIYYSINKKGNGVKPLKNKTVQILFKGRKMNNEEFDRCVDPSHPRVFEIGQHQIARGIEIIVQEMNEGDQITAIIPSSLAFGEKGNEDYGIPPFTPVVFDIELLRVVTK